MTVVYQDINGNVVSLDKLCRLEPEWAASRIRFERDLLKKIREICLYDNSGSVIATDILEIIGDNCDEQI